MNTLSYSLARKTLVQAMEQVCDDHQPVIITRKGSRSVVLMSLEDFHAIEETVYLLRNPINAANLMASIEQYKNGEYQERNLIEE
jgi:antitoxin YefM